MYYKTDKLLHDIPICDINRSTYIVLYNNIYQHVFGGSQIGKLKFSIKSSYATKNLIEINNNFYLTFQTLGICSYYLDDIDSFIQQEIYQIHDQLVKMTWDNHHIYYYANVCNKFMNINIRISDKFSICLDILQTSDNKFCIMEVGSYDIYVCNSVDDIIELLNFLKQQN